MKRRSIKIRLAGDGSTHYSALNIYAATPSREEQLFVLMHILATLDWTYYHVDEIRAFLSSKYNIGNKPVVTKFQGEDKLMERYMFEDISFHL